MKKFLLNMLSADSNTSSKRFNGFYGFAIYCLLTIFVVVHDVLKDGSLEEYSVVVMQLLAWTSAGLLGLAAVAEGIKNKLSK